MTRKLTVSVLAAAVFATVPIQSAALDTSTTVFERGIEDFRSGGPRSAADKPLLEALASIRRVQGDMALDTIRLHIELAALKLHGERRRYKHHLDDALAVARHQFGDASPELASVYLDIGQVLMGNTITNAHARPYLVQAHRVLEGHAGHPAQARSAFLSGRFFYSRHEHRKALDYFEAALAGYLGVGDLDQELATRAFMLEVLERLNRHDEASKHLHAIAEKLPWNDDAPPRALFKLNPQYPREAAAWGEEAKVVVSFIIERDGSVRDPGIVRIDGSPVFGRAVMAVIGRWRFVPLFQGGGPVETEGRYTIEFRMTD